MISNMLTAGPGGSTTVAIALSLVVFGVANAQAPAASSKQASTSAAAQGPAGDLVTGDNFEGMILAPSRSNEWRPEREDVLRLEKKLVSFVTSSTVGGRRPPIVRPEALAKYRRLYVGLDQRGKRRIQVYLLCELKNWPTRVSSWPRGGGACYMQATWDVASGTFVDLFVNSES
jgi:hypothetical protein